MRAYAVLTPKGHKIGEVEAVDIAEAKQTAIEHFGLLFGSVQLAQ